MTDFMQPTYNIQQILNGGEQALNDLFDSINSAPQALRTHTAEKFFSRLFNCSPLDPACNPLLDKLQSTFVNQACQSDQFYCDRTHPLRVLCECLLTRAITWYPRDARPNQLFLEKLSQLVDLAAAQETQPLVAALEEFCRWDDDEEKRAAMLESRLCESELNHLKILTAECRVLDLINEALTGSYLPLSFIELIPGTLKSELQHCAITAGSDSDFWKVWQRLLPHIAIVFASNSGDSSEEAEQQREQQRYRQIPAMLEELERSSRMDLGNPEQYRQLVDCLNQTLMQIIKKQPPPLARQEMLPYPAGHSDTRTRVTGSVLQQSHSIQQGDWILFTSEEGQVVRCKLALKNTATEQWLFVDRTGRKVMIKSSKDFSLCISAGIIKPLPRVSLEDMIDELIRALMRLRQKNLQQQQTRIATQESKWVNLQEIQQESHSQSRLLSEKQLQELKIREQQQLRALEFAEKRRLAAEKALAEARALAEEKTARALAAALEEKHFLQQQQTASDAAQIQQQLALQQINALNVGAWVERLDENQQPQRCKLAVLIAAADKYIFVDNLGRKVAEYQRAQLLEAFLSQQISTINNGEKFEDQLAKVIRSLRKDIH
ncbi:MAG TPA: DUF1631 family protein [Cellvibrio sp.]|nr:DUF1631 family protein [Cellvibrio sp.]